MYLFNKKKSNLNEDLSSHIIIKKFNFKSILNSLILLLTLFTITACSTNLYEPTNSKSNSLTNTINGKDSETNTKPEDIETTKEAIIDEGKEAINQEALLAANSIDLLIDSMTLEQKIAQLFIVDFYGMTNEYQLKEYTLEMHNFLKTYPVGGVIYFAENIESRNQVINLNETFQNDFAIPLFISVDEEGGLVSRLGKADIGVTHLETASQLSTLSVDDIETKAYELGLQIKELGFNMDFAPVLDVNTNVDNPVIGTRSFSSDASLAAISATAFSNGLIKAGIISSGKHFPGHGDTTTDSHEDLTIINHDLNRLRSVEFLPFKEAIANNIPTIMMGHINTPNLDDQELPASLSPYMITSLLRGELGFDGLVLTDSLRMQAITNYYQPKDVGVMLLKAGGDIILIPDNFEETYKGLLDAVNNGDITVERIDESLQRILKVKNDYSILNF